MKRVISFLLVIAMLVTSMMVPGQKVNAASKYIKVDAFIKLLVNALELEVDKKADKPYIDAALKNGILKDSDFKNYSDYITRTDVAVLANRADEYLNGDTVDEILLNTVIEKRISDITKITKSKREAVAKIVAKGIIKGYSNGNYVQNRRFKGSNLMTVNGAKGIINLVLNPKDRAKITPNGQLIRTTNLPKNADKYPYILESLPNSIYEQKFIYQRSTYYYEPKNLVDYASPSDLLKVKWIKEREQYLEHYCDLIRTNLETRFNVDYRTIDNEWVSNMLSTYWTYDSSDKKKITDGLNQYVKYVKKHKVIIKSNAIVVDPSLFCLSGGLYNRVYVDFKVTSSTSTDFSKVVYGDPTFINLKLNKDHQGLYEIELGTALINSNGSDVAIFTSYIDDYIYR